MQSEQDSFVKVIVVGDQGVGKTCLLNQYCYNKFDATTVPTIGCDFTMKITQYQGQNVRLQLWDIAGQERYKSVSKLYVRGALGCLIVCDIMNENSLAESIRWKQLVEDHCDQTDGKKIPIILLQNKYDEVKTMGKLEEFQKEENLNKFATENGFYKALQISAKENYNLTQSFDGILDAIGKSGLIKKSGGQGNFGSKKPQSQEKNQDRSEGAKIDLNNSSKPKNEEKKGGCC